MAPLYFLKIFCYNYYRKNEKDKIFSKYVYDQEGRK